MLLRDQGTAEEWIFVRSLYQRRETTMDFFISFDICSNAEVTTVGR